MQEMSSQLDWEIAHDNYMYLAPQKAISLIANRMTSPRILALPSGDRRIPRGELYFTFDCIPLGDEKGKRTSFDWVAEYYRVGVADMRATIEELERIQAPRDMALLGITNRRMASAMMRHFGFARVTTEGPIRSNALWIGSTVGNMIALSSQFEALQRQMRRRNR